MDTVALVLSGGGAKGSFEMGAVKALYTIFGVRPDVITSTSVGSINGVKLAEGGSPKPGVNDPARQAMSELENTWDGLQVNENMFVLRQWAKDVLDPPVGT